MSLVLADAKQARMELVIAPMADRVVRFAAGELAAYFERMCGAAFPVRKRASVAPDPGGASGLPQPSRAAT